MNPSISFNIYVMSYKRSHKIVTKNQFEYCTYVVRESEAEKYREAGIDNMLVIPADSGVNNFMSTLYWIIANTPEDVIFIADDDIERFVYRTDVTRNLLLDDDTPNKELVTAEVERIAQLLVDLGIGFGFDQPNLALYCYQREFSFLGVPGHVRWINKKAFKAKYDPEDPASSDVDMMMQELLENRICLQPKYLCVYAGDETNKGAIRNTQTEYIYIDAMKNKWGKYYDYNKKKNIQRIKVVRQNG